MPEQLPKQEIDTHCLGIFKLSDERSVTVQGSGGCGLFTFSNERGVILGESNGIHFEPFNGATIPHKIYFRLVNEVEGLRFKSDGPELLDVYDVDGPDYCTAILLSSS